MTIWEFIGLMIIAVIIILGSMYLMLVHFIKEKDAFYDKLNRDYKKYVQDLHLDKNNQEETT